MMQSSPKRNPFRIGDVVRRKTDNGDPPQWGLVKSISDTHCMVSWWDAGKGLYGKAVEVKHTTLVFVR